MRIAVAATPAIAIPALEHLHEKHEIAFVITQPDRPFGRGREMRETEVAQWAKEKGLKVFKSLQHEAEISSVDVVVTIAYGVLVPKKILSLPKNGFINLHYSLLPLWRGAAPVQRSLIAGDVVTGVTVFQLDEGMDTGPIYIQKQLQINSEWSARELFDSLNILGAQALLETLDQVSQGARPEEQSGIATYAPKISKDEYQVDFSWPSSRVVNSIRGLYPNAFFLVQGRRIKILRGHVGPKVEAHPYILISIDPVVVSCGEGTSVVLDEVTPEGKRSMSAQEWIRGARVDAGTSLD